MLHSHRTIVSRVPLAIAWMCVLIVVTASCDRVSVSDGRVWLDRPLENWNHGGQTLKRAPAAEEPLTAIVIRCQLTRLASTAAERAVSAAGWLPFLPGGAPQLRDGVEIVGGMAWADGMCRPAMYNYFVFVGDRFAGTLSPVLMTSRLDGSAGMLAVDAAGISLEFARYTEADPLCCPSGRVTVRCRVDRTVPLVIPTMRTATTK